MRIYIDGDACPVVKEVLKISKHYNLKVTLVKNYHHEINIEGIEIVTVDFASDSADYYIANRLEKGDVLITQDYGLMSMALSKQAFCINQNGLIVDENNIDGFLERRHYNKKMMKQGVYKSKFKKRGKKDNIYFEENFKKLIISSKNFQ